MSVRIIQGDCRDVLATLDAASIDACVTDPPYGLEFMSVAWDTFGDGRKGGERVPNTWNDHGSKEHPRNAFQAAQVRRKKSVAFEAFSREWCETVLPILKPGGYLVAFGGTRTYHRLTCAIEDAGFEIRDCLMWLYGSGFPKGKGCLKPGWEPIILARKPGPSPWLNVDGCRIETTDNLNGGAYAPNGTDRYDGYEKWRFKRTGGAGEFEQPAGRWPANVVLDEEAAAILDEQAGLRKSGAYTGARRSPKFQNAYGTFPGTEAAADAHEGSVGPASRFFYCSKASTAERGPGNDWPTVKPLALMQWLIRLVVPAGGLVVDPFLGSGTTALACDREGFDCIGIENDPHAIEIARRRLESEAPLFADVEVSA